MFGAAWRATRNALSPRPVPGLSVVKSASRLTSRGAAAGRYAARNWPAAGMTIDAAQAADAEARDARLRLPRATDLRAPESDRHGSRERVHCDRSVGHGWRGRRRVRGGAQARGARAGAVVGERLSRDRMEVPVVSVRRQRQRDHAVGVRAQDLARRPARGAGGRRPQRRAAGADGERADAGRVGGSDAVHRREAFVVVLVTVQHDVDTRVVQRVPRVRHRRDTGCVLAGAEPWVMPHRRRAHGRVRGEVAAQPRELFRVGRHVDVAVEHDDVPARLVVAVPTLRARAGRVAEVVVVRPPVLGDVLVVAGNRTGAGLEVTPGGVVAGRVVGVRAVGIRVVAERHDGAVDPVDHRRGRSRRAAPAHADVTRADEHVGTGRVRALGRHPRDRRNGRAHEREQRTEQRAPRPSLRSPALAPSAPPPRGCRRT